MIKVKDCVGKSVILEERSVLKYRKYTEVKFLKLSPSKSRVKVKYPSDYECWEDITRFEHEHLNFDDFVIVEVLKK